MDKDKMLKQMCRVELNQADIKAICKLRALPPACLQSRTLLQHNFLSDAGIESTFVPLRSVSTKKGYGPGGNPGLEGRDYSIAWEQPPIDVEENRRAREDP